MIKKSVVLLVVVLLMVCFTSTGTASLVSSKEELYERFHDHPVFRTVMERISQLVVYTGNSGLVDGDEEESEDTGGEPVDDADDTPTVEVEEDIDEASQSEGVTVDEAGATEVVNEETVDAGDWVVEQDGEGGTLERFVRIVTVCDGKIGAMLQRVVERTIAPDTEASTGNAEHIVNTVVAGESGESATKSSTNVVVTAGDQ